MFKKNIGIFISVLAIVLSMSAPILAGDKVGYVDLQRLVKESKMGKAAMLDIEMFRKEKQQLISGTLQNINKFKIGIETRHEEIGEEEKKDKIKELNSLIKEYKRMVADAKEDIATEDRELVSSILKKADGALQKIAKKKKFTMILKDPNTIGYLDPSVDITNDVLTELNRNK